jgi:hypothetical protein
MYIFEWLINAYINLRVADTCVFAGTVATPSQTHRQATRSAWSFSQPPLCPTLAATWLATDQAQRRGALAWPLPTGGLSGAVDRACPRWRTGMRTYDKETCQDRAPHGHAA